MKTVSVPSAAPAPQPPAAALKLMSDERLARWAARGSQPAFAVIFERHHQALHRYCHSIVGNSHDAADALQNTMLKALGALPGERRAITLKPWLYRIAHNESISLLRARRGDRNLDAAAQIGDLAADTIAESRERLRDLTSDLRDLTEQQRGALLMRELGGLTFDDVSAALQVSASAAKQSVYEARCALQALEQGRAMDCDLVRRTLSDGDRRTLRGMKLRGHLRACAGCRDFETAVRRRPAHLAALTPALPLATAASILHGLLGAGAGAGTGAGHGGGGLLAAIGVGAKGVGGTSLATKVATIAVVAGGAGGAAVTAPALDAPAPNRAAAAAAPGADRAAAPRLAAAPRMSSAHATTLEGEAALVAAVKADAGKQAPASAHRVAGDDTPASTQQHALQTAVDRANAGRPAADRPLRAPDAVATPASPGDGRRTSDDARAGRSAPAAPPQAWQQPVAGTSRLTPAPASRPLPAAAPPAPAEPGSTEPAGATAAAVIAAR